MARIFLSYSREDRELAQRIAAVLEAAGFDVWWDRHQILPGESFAETIERELTRADQVLVLWSPHSEGDHWVLGEAGEARDKLVWVLVGSASPPRGFRAIPTVDLADWDGNFEASQAQMLVEALRRCEPKARFSPTRQPSVFRMEAPSPSAEAPRGKAAGIGRTAGAAVGAVAAGAAGLAISAGRAMRALGRRITRTGGGDHQARPAAEPVAPPPAVRGPGNKPIADEDRTSIVAPPGQREPDFSVDCLDLFGSETNPEAVMLAVAAPRRARPGSSFNARFSTYVEDARASAMGHLIGLGEEGDRIVADLSPDRKPNWRPGAPVTVRLSGAHLTASPAERNFEWNGRENTVTFAVTVDPNAPAAQVQLCFHVFLGPVEISLINIGVMLGVEAADTSLHRELASMPSSAFASYASRDAVQVAQRLSTLAHWAPSLDIFQDCLDLAPNEDFKPQMAKQIAARDVFLLFWSRNAMASQWVRWELDTARARPGIGGILPMPLEDPAIAPPPPGFEDKHLRDRYLIAGYGQAKIGELAATPRPPA